ncbi:MAG: NADPH-dependent glutamate synthase [Bacteroidales bacterium]|jgi:glutamate synthase (NADPH/NADH) small chain|nr:NADPH-dependent glutamate synthase [Bacteroidales bacterium]
MNNRRNEEWREILRKKMPAKDRVAIDRVKMNELDPHERIKWLDKEVNMGLTEEQVVREASRCMDCANPTCIEGCPVNIDIPTFVKYIEDREFDKSIASLKESNALPAVCGRVCPQEKQCEANCFLQLKMKKEPVAIGYLERYVADLERESGKRCVPYIAKSNGIKVATCGSGPASLSFAGDMAKLGYDVTVFEALHEIGGVLKYGIPEFRLPNSIVDFEIENLKHLGVKFEKNFLLGRTSSFDDLREKGFKGFFIGSGAGLPNFMNIPGENFNGILSSNEYLTRVNLMRASDENYDTPVFIGKRVAVIGGGNTAMDSVRIAKRLGAEAMIIYRRSREEMPARVEEVKHAMEEGIVFMNLHNPTEYFADETGHVNKMRLQKMILGEPDASGRRKPVATNEFTDVDVDLVVVAIGVSPNPLIPMVEKNLNVSKWGTIIVNEENNQTDINDMFAGGDIVRGGATVILAMGDGRKAATGMHKHLTKN